MLKPYGFDFSHPSLRSCFSIELVKRALLNRRIKLKDRMLAELEADIRFLNEKIGEITGFLFELKNYEIELKKELTRKLMEKIEDWAYNF